ncbi:hypothetical protein [Nocardioides sp.]|uniref:hypothetical protein n=1 Tax=Nocardioides sp. TaxID=35761 RepID=UPI0039E2310A
MPYKKRLALVAALGTLLTLLTPALPSAQAYPCGRPSGCTSFELVSAGASYDWYPVKHRYEFKGGRTEPKEWEKSKGNSKQYQQNGMLTLVANKGKHTKPVTSTWTGRSHYYDKGRWETRMRMAPESSGGNPWMVEVALTPVSKKQYFCGAQDIHLLHWSPTEPSTAQLDINTLPDNRFTMEKKLSRSITNDEWHVFAVEVTKERVLWFVDAQVVANEPRDKALSGKKFKFQVRLIPTAPGKVQEKFRIQLDWARYWTLAKPNSKSVAAPKTDLKTNRDACPPVEQQPTSPSTTPARATR